MSNEIKIGLLAIVTIALFLWGYKFVEGRNILDSIKVIYAEYEDVNGLREGTSIMRSGVKVGVVTAVELNPENLKTVIVEMAIETNLPIPKSAVAIIATTDFLGEKRVILHFDRPCSGTNCVESGDYLKGGLKGVMSTMLGSPDELKSYVSVVSEGAKSVLDSLGQTVSDENSAIGKALSDMDIILQNLKTTTSSLNALIRQNSSEINSIVDDVAILTKTVEGKSQALESIISNVDTFAREISKLNLVNTVQSVEGTVENLNNTLSGADAAIVDIKLLLDQVNKGNGTLGKLVNDATLYEQIDKAMQNLDFLLQDIRLHPERYRRILSKKEMPYEPTKDPAFDEQN